MAKLLIVDDEMHIRDLVQKYATFENYESETAENGLEAIEKVKHNEYDLVIMDIMMPELDGFSAVKEIRKISQVPVIMLSARSEEYDKLYGFDLGIDDYVTKPFSPKELVARVKAITKRYHNEEDKMIFGSLTLDDKAHEVRIDDKLVTLTPKEYDLLKCFLTNHHIALSREQLLTNIWGYDFYGDDRTVDTHVKTLRQHLGKYGKYIKTIRKVGYKFEYED